MNWLDIVIIAIIAYSALRGYMKGLILSVVGLISLLLALLVANKYYLALTDYLIVCWQLDRKIAELFKPAASPPLYDQSAGESSALLTQILQKISIYGQNTVGELLQLMLGQGILRILCFILLFFITDKLIKIIGVILHSFFDWGFLAPVNRLGGMVFGSLRGVLLVVVILAVIVPLQLPATLWGGETTLTKAVNQSSLVHWLWPLLKNIDWSPVGDLLTPYNLKDYFNTI